MGTFIQDGDPDRFKKIKVLAEDVLTEDYVPDRRELARHILRQAVEIERLQEGGKRRRIRELEMELRYAHDDYQHTHDGLWQILSVLCDEFGLKLTIKPKDEDA